MALLALLGHFASVSPSRMSRRIARIESEKSGRCSSMIVHSLRLHTFNHFFPCGYGLNPQGTILQLIDDLLRLKTPLNNSLYYFMKNYCNLIGLEQLYFSLI